jgi:hypothetical protein
MPDPHVFNPDLLNDCTDCPLPARNRVHLTPTAPVSDFQPVLDPRSHARATDPSTSLNAAVELTDKATMMRNLLYAYRNDMTDGGLTAEEACAAASYTAEDGAWKRVSDLKAAGWIEPTGTTRPGLSGRAQAVCRITDTGRQALA